MPRDYKIKMLSVENAALAYPLIQSAQPKIALDDWLVYARKINSRKVAPTNKSGIISAESKRGYIHGIFCYSVQPTLDHGTVLAVENFIAVDTGDRAAAIKSLIAMMGNLARELGCSAIHTHIPNHWISKETRGTAMLHHLRDAGHQPEFVEFCKIVAAP
jgi:hypothetical protein